MNVINLKCPICKAIFSVGVYIEKKICTSKECPKCKTEIEMK